MATLPQPEVIEVSVARPSPQNVYARDKTNRINVVFTLTRGDDERARQYTNEDEPVVELITGHRYRFVLRQQFGEHIFYLSRAGSVGGSGNFDDALGANELGADTIFEGVVVDGAGIRRGSIEFTAPAFDFAYNCSVNRHTGMGGPIGVRSLVACLACGAEAQFECSRCKDAKYCSAECQYVNYPSHVRKCRQMIGAESDRVLIVVDLEPVVGVDRKLAVPLDAFTKFGRSELVELIVAGDTSSGSLLFDPANPFVVEFKEFGAKKGRAIEADRVQALSERTSLLDFQAPPFPVLDYSEAAAFKSGTDRQQDEIEQFFTTGQGFLPSQFVSQFSVDIFNRRKFDLVYSVEAPKTQYLRRLIMLFVLHAAKKESTEELVDNIFDTYVGSAGGTTWSWPEVARTMQNKRDLFTVNVDDFTAAIDAWLVAVGKTQVQ